MRTSNNESVEWAKILAQDPAEVAPFDLDGCSNEWSIFDIRRHDDGPQMDSNKRVRGRLQLDSGYYLEAEASRTPQEAVECPKEDLEGPATTEGTAMMRVEVSRKNEVHEWEVCPHDTVLQLQLLVQNRWGIEPAQ